MNLGEISVELGFVLFFIGLVFVQMTTVLIILSAFSRKEYAIFKQYKIQSGEDYNWPLFVGAYWLRNNNQEYAKLREQALGPPSFPFFLQRMLFGIVVVGATITYIVVMARLFVME